LVTVGFLSEPAGPAGEALPGVALAPPSGEAGLLLARAGPVKEWLEVLGRLQALGLSARAAERGPDAPLVAAWAAGPADNPEPLVVVVDLILLGGGWPLLGRVLAALGPARGRAGLERLAGIPGVYLPSLHLVTYEAAGPIARVTPVAGAPPPRGLPGGAPFAPPPATGYRRYAIGGPGGGADEVARAVKRERHAERSRLRREPEPWSVSLAAFVPTPWSHSQWAPMAPEERLKAELGRAARLLARVAGVRVTHEPPKWALLEGVLRMGDRRAGELLLLARRLGWDLARVQSPLNPAFILHRARPRAEVLPWDHLDWGVDRDRLWEEFSRWTAA
jgi:nucleotide-binding universal stress UspA family protein